MELIGVGVAGVIFSLFSISAAIHIDMATFFLSALIIITLKVKESKFVQGRINAKECFNTLKVWFRLSNE